MKYDILLNLLSMLDFYCLQLLLDVPDFPKDPQRGSHEISLGPLMYIERSDFMEESRKGFRRLTPNQPVGLKYTSSIISVQHIVKVCLICIMYTACCLSVCLGC